VRYAAALALSLAGDASQYLADDLGRRFPENTVTQVNFLPTLRAQLALNRSATAAFTEHVDDLSQGPVFRNTHLYATTAA